MVFLILKDKHQPKDDWQLFLYDKDETEVEPEEVEYNDRVGDMNERANLRCFVQYKAVLSMTCKYCVFC